MADEKNIPDSEDEGTGLLFTFPDFELPEFDMTGFDIIDEPDQMGERYLKPKVYKHIQQRNIKYDNAVALASNLTLGKDERANIIVAGSFIFGDFIEAYIRHHNAKIKTMTISTLSLSQDNIDSLAALLKQDFVDELNMIISHYFFANERNVLIPYMYRELDIDNKFQLAVAGSHTKTVTMETLGGKFIVMHGSANLRSSANLEQFTIEENRELHDFYKEYQDRIIDKYRTINKPIRVKPLWDIINTKKFK